MLVLSDKIKVPDDIIFLIISVLSLDDILRFSQTCAYLYSFLNQVKIQTYLLENSLLCV